MALFRAVYLIAPVLACTRKCPFDTQSYTEVAGECVCYPGAGGEHPVDPTVVDACLLDAVPAQCQACPSNPAGWRAELSRDIDVLHIHARCRRDDTPGPVSLAPLSTHRHPALRVDGDLNGLHATVRGPCPLFTLYGGGTVANLRIECESGDAAIVVKGPGVTISNVVSANVPTTVLARLAGGVNVDRLAVTNTRNEGSRVVAVLGHTFGSVSITCVDQTSQVVALRRGGSAKYKGCDYFDLGHTLDAYGSYEVEYFHKNAFVDTLGDFEYRVLQFTAQVLALGVVWFVVVHQRWALKQFRRVESLAAQVDRVVEKTT